MPPSPDWKPFRPTEPQKQQVADDVAVIEAIQQELLDHPGLPAPDRVAHQHQIAGSKVTLTIAGRLPEPLEGVGLFVPNASHQGIGRISLGLGFPHPETEPDFVGLMAAFQTSGKRVDFLAINDPRAPADDHPDFLGVLRASAKAAGDSPFVPGRLEWVVDQVKVAIASIRFGSGEHLARILQQTTRITKSGTAYLTYWTGVVETGGVPGKFVFEPARDERLERPRKAGSRYLTEEWSKRQRAGDIELDVYWLSFVSERDTPPHEPHKEWSEGDNKVRVGRLTFPRIRAGEEEEAELWSLLAQQMGANPGHWIHDRADGISEPATEFGLARKLAYALSQRGRGALSPEAYADVFTPGASIGPELAKQLRAGPRPA